MNRFRRVAAVAIIVHALISCSVTSAATDRDTASIALHGTPQRVQMYGSRGGTPVIITSGDGGWIHLAPQVAELLAARGYFVVGLDARAYLASCTSGSGHVEPGQVATDYRTLLEFASHGASGRPILIGVSAGAALSVLAASDPAVKPLVAGVIGLGLPDRSELAWRWRDAVIYVTHGVPDEPSFSTASIVPRVAPVPLAAIHSTHDEFVPLEEVRRVIDAAREPKRLWIVEAENHRFSGNTTEFSRRLEEAIQWVRSHAAR